MVCKFRRWLLYFKSPPHTLIECVDHMLMNATRMTGGPRRERHSAQRGPMAFI